MTTEERILAVAEAQADYLGEFLRGLPSPVLLTRVFDVSDSQHWCPTHHRVCLLPDGIHREGVSTAIDLLLRSRSFVPPVRHTKANSHTKTVQGGYMPRRRKSA